MHGTIALRLGGVWVAASHWVAPMYDGPKVPTTPLAQGCVRRPLDSVVAVGLLDREAVPGSLELKRPRQSVTNTL